MPSRSSRLVPEYIERLVPYQPGKPIGEVQRELGLDRVVKLASNENPFGVSPLAREAAFRAMAEAHNYPDASGHDLRQALTHAYKVEFENTIVGAGSEGIMANIVRTFLHGDEEVLTSEGTFIGFMVLARSQGVPIRLVPLRDYAFDLDAMAAEINPRTKIVYLANPNNPTGTLFTRSAFERFYAKVPPHVLIIQDEAYHEFVGADATYPDSQLYRYDNVITLRTFSKAYGLAGLRVGYGLAAAPLIEQLHKVKLPFEPNGVAMAAALAALDDTAFLDKTLANNSAGLARFYSAFARLGIPHVRSWGNFVMVDLQTEERSLGICDALLRRGIIVRPLRAFGLPHCVRVSVGTAEENDQFLEALEEILGARDPVSA
ncbi:MAG: histidinol-phosphate transaminase [Candidatus Sericytochromatia bacterium]|nr:histidinol-phosphate transaminase [Candidatus Tanganyikabacteria bacterium]